MVLEENPITAELHEQWRSRIRDDLNVSIDTRDCLSLIQYLDKTPQKFYSEEAFEGFYQFLCGLKSTEIKPILDDNKNLINHSVRILQEINELNIHDNYYPDDDLDLLNFIDSSIHYNYLKILETSFYHLIYFVAVHSRKSRGKPIEKLDLYNCVEELKTGKFKFIAKHYNNTIRNGIAHGKIQIYDGQLRYIDKKGNSETISFKKIVRLFDDLIDCVNGFVLGLRVFFLSNINQHTPNITIPQSLLLDELQHQANGPAWQIVTSFEGGNIRNQKQLNLYIKNDFFDFYKVQYNAFRTAVLTEKFATGYNRIFINLKSKNSKFESSGFVSFDGDKLKELRKSGTRKIEDYEGVMEDNLLFFVPKYRLPKLIYKLGTFRMGLRGSFSLHWGKYLDTYFPRIFTFRDFKTHVKSGYIVIERACVILESKDAHEMEELIRGKASSLIRKAKKYAKRQYKLFSLNRFLKVRYTRVFVYDKNLRKRKLRDGGLSPDLICILHRNQTKSIKSLLPLGTIEHGRKYEIIWNDNWKAGVRTQLSDIN